MAIALTTPFTAMLLWGLSASTLARVSLLALPLFTVTWTLPSRSVSMMKTIPPCVLMLLTQPKTNDLLAVELGSDLDGIVRPPPSTQALFEFRQIALPGHDRDLEIL